VQFIDENKNHRDGGGLLWRVEPIIQVLASIFDDSISSSGYYEFKRRLPSPRSECDALRKEVILEAFVSNYSCYGVVKIWKYLKNQDYYIPRCTVARLMKELGIQGCRRGKIKKTTISGKDKINSDDLVKRVFQAGSPNKLWVADFTYVSTQQGWVYTALVTDVFARRILGWSCNREMTDRLVTDAFKMASYTRALEGNRDFSDLIHHNDKGCQYTSGNFRSLLSLHGIRTSIGSVGDSFDNALAETMIGIYKTELIRNNRTWYNYGQLNLETARWVNWYNNQRISQYNNWKTPLETEKIWYDNGTDARKSRTKESLTVH